MNPSRRHMDRRTGCVQSRGMTTTNAHDPVLVLGATGRQGGATARALLRRSHDVHALVRDPRAPAARQLAQQGALLVQGDLDDPASLRAAVADARAVFSVQPHPMSADGIEQEVRRGKVVGDAAKAAGIAHLVYSSVAGAERATGVPHFASKWAIEQHLRALGLPLTVLRPAMFMDNFAGHSRPHLVDGTLAVRLPVALGTPLQIVASQDIGAFAADVIERPDDYIGRALELAGEAPTGSEMAQAFERVTGTPARFEQQPLDEVRAFSNDMALMWEWIQNAGYESADIAALRERHPGLLTLAAWLERTGWRVEVPT